MLHHTHGLVIRSVKYGETSLVVSMFTELFGLQQFMVNGVRTSKVNRSISPMLLQPGNFLDMVVYHNEKQSLQRIKECRPALQFQDLFVNLKKNTVMLFMIEILQKTIRQTEPHPELYHFIEDVMKALDASTPSQMANIPLFFMSHLSHFFGFRLMDNYSNDHSILDWQEGQFVQQVPSHVYYLEEPQSGWLAQLLRVAQIHELDEIKLNRNLRNQLLDGCLNFYALHVQPFGPMKSLSVLRAIMDD
ncbi:MAG: repair protein RecO [Bacteroidota bacterium]|jgi:DNA repair protein RecO (recombination protein O)